MSKQTYEFRFQHSAMGRKRKIETCSFLNESSNSCGQQQPITNNLHIVQRSAANDRERTRMRVLSKAFVKLKTSLPWVPSDTKLSKLDTLKLATSYISYLTKILEDDELNTPEVISQAPGNFANDMGQNQASCRPAVVASQKSQSGFERCLKIK